MQTIAAAALGGCSQELNKSCVAVVCNVRGCTEIRSNAERAWHTDAPRTTIQVPVASRMLRYHGLVSSEVPLMLRTLFHMIGRHYANGNLGAAESSVRSVLAAVPNDPASLQFLGLVYYRTGRKAAAIDILNAAPPLCASQSPLQAMRSDDFLGRNRYSAAAACQVEATQRNPDLAQVWLDLALTLGELDQPARAVDALQYALLAQPGFPAAVRAMDSMTRRAAVSLDAGALSPSSAAAENLDCGSGRALLASGRPMAADPTTMDEDA